MANSVFNVSQLNGTNGFAIDGIASYDRSGTSVSGSADINGDGIDDLIIGAPTANPTRRPVGRVGQSYVVFGGDSVGSGGSINLSTLNGTNGFTLNGVPFDGLGASVSAAGDINDDEIDDLIIGATGGGIGGRSYVVFGGDSVDSDGSINLSTLNGTNGFAINSFYSSFDGVGASVSAAGDFNGDGIDDVIIGAPGAPGNDGFPTPTPGPGQSYVVFGGASVGSSGSINVFFLGRGGFVLDGIGTNPFFRGFIDSSGESVSAAGDFNGDGIDDVIIGAPGASPNGRQSAGQSYVVFGSTSVGTGNSFNLQLSTLNGTNGFAINGIFPNDRLGSSVSDAGDINGDGIDDLIIGAPNADSRNAINAGQSYVVFGGASVGGGGSINVSTLNGTNGFAINGIASDDSSGARVSAAGDINGDGIDDLIIGAPSADPNGINSAGQSYVVFGSPSVGSGGRIDLSTLNGTNGFVINGIASNDRLGASVSAAGDINNDGIDDLIIGAPDASLNGISFAGQSYVVFGNTAPSLDLNGSSSGIDFTTAFSGTQVSVVDLANLSITDNNANLSSATVTITNLRDGVTESLSANTENTNIAANYDSRSGILRLTGTDTIANYQQVLRSARYNNTTPAPDTTTRIIEFVVDDGQAHTNTSAVATTTLNINVNTNLVNGTLGRDNLIGTPGNDRIAGLQGADILTGGAGNDVFVYNSIRDARDTITDFQVGADVILLSLNLFQLDSSERLSFNYQSAIESGFLGITNQGNNSIISIDPDGTTGRAIFTPLLTVSGVSAQNLANPNNFVI
jgi:hypothetical protein